MSGDATFSGTAYQARAIAYIYVHILSHTRLGWLEDSDDIPAAVSAETGGIGDDARIEFVGDRPSIEVQAKHGLTAGKKLDEAIRRIKDASSGVPNSPVILAIDRTSSQTVRIDLARDLKRLRSLRTDGLKAEARRLLASGEFEPELLKKIIIIPLDVDWSHDEGSTVALNLLGNILADPSQVNACWHILSDDASEISKAKMRRSRKELVDRLAVSKIRVKPLGAAELIHRDLDFCKSLLKNRNPEAALAVLEKVQESIATLPKGPDLAEINYWYHYRRAAAMLQMDSYKESIAQAQRALDFKSQGKEALIVLSTAELFLGNTSKARTLAEAAVQKDPHDANAWGTLAYVISTTTEKAPVPPADVRSSEPYRLVLADIAAKDGQWETVLSITDSLISEGCQDANAFILRAQAFMYSSGGILGEAYGSKHEQAARFCTEALSLLDRESNPSAITALQLRAQAYSQQAKHEESEADIKRLGELAPENLGVLRQTAEHYYKSNQKEVALEILQHPAVKRDPHALALRAQIHADLDNKAHARRDLELTLSLISTTTSKDGVALIGGSVATAIGDETLTNDFIALSTLRDRESITYKLVLGDASILKRDAKGAVEYYMAAANASSEHKINILIELATKLAGNGFARESVDTFDMVGDRPMSINAMMAKAHALWTLGNFSRAKDVIEQMTSKGELPEGALRMAADIAIRQQDGTAAAAHLTELTEKHNAENRVRTQLARTLLGLNREPEALQHIRTVLSSPSVSPYDQMCCAELLCAADQPQEALRAALGAYRAAPEDPNTHRLLVTIVLTGGAEMIPQATVETDSYVCLTDEDGSTREYVIYEHPPFSPLRKEISLENARSLGLIGVKEGDVVSSLEQWNPRHWKVSKILPAVLYVAQDAAQNFEQRFPGEDFFVTSRKIRNSTGEASIRDFLPLITMANDRDAKIKKAFRLYHSHGLPLGMLAKMIRVNVPSSMERSPEELESQGPVVIEHLNKEGLSRSIEAASEAKDLTISRSALHTLHKLKLLDALKTFAPVRAPKSVEIELLGEIEEAKILVKEGRKAIGSDGPGLRIIELEPNSPIARSHLDDIQAQATWLTNNAKIEPRPTETLEHEGSKEDQVRESVGYSSYDSVALARHRKSTLYADDLGLRIMLADTQGVVSFSSVSLLDVLAQRQIISNEHRDRCLLQLALSHYIGITPSKELLWLALQNSEASHHESFIAFRLLGLPLLELLDAARIVVSLIKQNILEPIRTVSSALILDMSLRSMSRLWYPRACARAIVNHARGELLLFPRELQSLEKVAVKFVNSEREKTKSLFGELKIGWPLFAPNK